jgi:predicted TIM-barrel fold metal-dependent hydrolase
MARYGFVDVDNHVYESDDCFTRYLDPSFKHASVTVREVKHDQRWLFIGDKPTRWFPQQLGFRTFPPGALRSFEMTGSAPSPINSSEHPSLVDRASRIAFMHSVNVEACILHPTVGFQPVRELMAMHPAAGYATLRAFNRWFDEEWGFDYESRLFAAPLLHLADPELALAEVSRLLDAGARVIDVVTFGPGSGHSAGDPILDPIWARIVEANAVICFHASGAGTTHADLYSPPAHVTRHGKFTAFQQFLIGRSMVDMIAGLVMDRALTRFPGLRLLVVESGAAWIRPVLQLVNDFALEDRDALVKSLRDAMWVNPYAYEARDVATMIGVHRVCMGTDYPHPEGLTDPLDYLEGLSSFSAREQRLIMRENAATLLGRLTETAGEV